MARRDEAGSRRATDRLQLLSWARKGASVLILRATSDTPTNQPRRKHWWAIRRPRQLHKLELKEISGPKIMYYRRQRLAQRRNG